VRSVPRPAIVADALVTPNAIDASRVQITRVRVCCTLVKVFAEKSVSSKTRFNFGFSKILTKPLRGKKTCFRVVRWIPSKLVEQSNLSVLVSCNVSLRQLKEKWAVIQF